MLTYLCHHVRRGHHRYKLLFRQEGESAVSGSRTPERIFDKSIRVRQHGPAAPRRVDREHFGGNGREVGNGGY